MGESPTTPAGPAADAGERRKAFDALAEVSADGIVVLDDDSVVRYVNPAVERILGYAPDELTGEPLVTIIPDHLQEAHTEAFQQYLDTGEKHVDWTYVELPGCHKDDHEVPLGISFNEFTHDGEHYFVGTFRDISQRKEVERELERQNERLEQFANMLAHELRNPLEIAQIYLDFLDGEDDATVGQIADALDRIDEIIEVLLVLARGREDPDDREAVNLTDVAEDVWDNVETGDAELEVTGTQTIRVNPAHTRLLLENLFRNAVEHGSTSPRSQAHEDAVEHGSTSSLPEADDAVEHGSTNHRQQNDDAGDHDDGPIKVWVGPLVDGFYVEDTGSGIPESERQKVVQAGYTTDTDGLGIGLTFVTQLADVYGWEYAITDSDEGGARFEFTGVEIVNNGRAE